MLERIGHYKYPKSHRLPCDSILYRMDRWCSWHTAWHTDWQANQTLPKEPDEQLSNIWQNSGGYLFPKPDQTGNQTVPQTNGIAGFLLRHTPSPSIQKPRVTREQPSLAPLKTVSPKFLPALFSSHYLKENHSEQLRHQTKHLSNHLHQSWYLHKQYKFHLFDYHKPQWRRCRLLGRR